MFLFELHFKINLKMATNTLFLVVLWSWEEGSLIYFMMSQGFPEAGS